MNEKSCIIVAYFKLISNDVNFVTRVNILLFHSVVGLPHAQHDNNI